jgi:hypothetical protein
MKSVLGSSAWQIVRTLGDAGVGELVRAAVDSGEGGGDDDDDTDTDANGDTDGNTVAPAGA